MSVRLARRRVMVVPMAVLASACSGESSPLDDVPTRAHRPSSPPTSSDPAQPSETDQPTPSARIRWRPGPGELVPEAKLTAVRRVERLDRTLEVTDAQYGGLLSTTASVLVVTSHRTFDVRLSLRGEDWIVTEVRPSRPGRPTRRPSRAARHVLRSSRIELPPAARADVAAGQVHDVVLEAMLAVSRRWAFGVSVIRSGHPLYVFGTDRLSDHPRGFAFDVWQVDGHPVVAPSTPQRLITRFMEALVAAGGDNVGGPYQLAGAEYFSDQTHHDHVHAGFPG